VEFGRLAVQAFEQMGLKGQIENIGSIKKAGVIEAIQSFADAHKIKISASDLDMIIEGALRDGVHKAWGEETVPATTTANNDATPSFTYTNQG